MSEITRSWRECSDRSSVFTSTLKMLDLVSSSRLVVFTVYVAWITYSGIYWKY